MSKQIEINRKALQQFRKQLNRLGGSFSGSAERVLRLMTQAGVAQAKADTPAPTGYMRRNWKASPYRKVGRTHISGLQNNVEYASFVNNGHRVVNRSGATVGFCEGKFILEKGVTAAERSLPGLLAAEIERVKRETKF